MNDLRLEEGKESMLATLSSNTRLLVSRQKGLGQWLLEAVDPDSSGFDLGSKPVRTNEIIRPNGTSETTFSIIDPCHEVLLVGPLQNWNNGA